MSGKRSKDGQTIQTNFPLAYSSILASQNQYQPRHVHFLSTPIRQIKMKTKTRTQRNRVDWYSWSIQYFWEKVTTGCKRAVTGLSLQNVYKQLSGAWIICKKQKQKRSANRFERNLFPAHFTLLKLSTSHYSFFIYLFFSYMWVHTKCARRWMNVFERKVIFREPILIIYFCSSLPSSEITHFLLSFVSRSRLGSYIQNIVKGGNTRLKREK